MTTQTNATGPLPSEASLAEKPIAPQSTNGSAKSARFIPKAASKHIGEDVDDELSHHNGFFVKLLAQSVGDSWAFFLGSVLSMTAFSALCTWAGEELHKMALENPDGSAQKWIEDIEDGKDALSIIGTLFVFSLVFRFNACYDRWWDARRYWGDMISKRCAHSHLLTWTTCYVMRISLSLSLVLTNESFL